MSLPRVYEAVRAITAELAPAGIPKSHVNLEDQYLYRSIDDVLNRLAPLLAKHGLCVLPRVLERSVVDRQGTGEALLVHVCLRVAYDLVCVTDGSVHTVEAFGEALDPSDKATSKAMSAAYKGAMLQTFCIPVAGAEEADSHSHKLKVGHDPEPIGGWPAWVEEVISTIGICEAEEALGRVQRDKRGLLLSLSRERPDLYAQVGAAFAIRRQQFGAGCANSPKASEAVREAGREAGREAEDGPERRGRPPKGQGEPQARAVTTAQSPPKRARRRAQSREAVDA